MTTVVSPNDHASASATGKLGQRSKKSRLARRRGRIQTGSDDEIEREARSDSDSEDQSSLDSESDSETASDDEHHPGIVTPSTTQSPPPLDINGSSSSVKPHPIVSGPSGPFVGTTDWAQMVAEENKADGESLPVIDFAEMHSHAIPEPVRSPLRSKKAQKQAKKAHDNRPSQETPPEELPRSEEPQVQVQDEDPEASTSHTATHDPSPPRSRGQSVRQAYQERLQQDPAFVPRVGEFWGHDDRLLEKDLRSLSGWWRGRWHNRGRGRGRGGRGFFAGRAQPLEGHVAPAETPIEASEDIPPIERAWTHDGFEEMKRKEEQRRTHVQPQAQPQPPVSHGTSLRGRGGFTHARGRGGITREGRATPSMDANDAGRHEAHNAASSRRIWFAMKPEKMWTKNADTFLYMDSSQRARSGQGGNVRIKLPGAPQVYRAYKQAPKATFVPSTPDQTGSSSSIISADDTERHFVVRFPSAKTARTAVNQANAESTKPASTSVVEPELSLEEVFTIRPHAVPSHVPIDIRKADSAQSLPTATQQNVNDQSDISALPDPSIVRQLEQLGMSGGASKSESTTTSAILEETLLRKSATEEPAQTASSPSNEQTRSAPPMLHPLQTSFSPTPTTSPPYGSPYAFGPPAMPPGIAMSQQGYPYEVSTGRPVYLQHVPPPVYTPRPMMHPYMGPPLGMPFVPGHMSHHSQEFVPQPHTPVNSFTDPATGVPIFSPARQNNRVEIRAPDGKLLKSIPRSSGLRTSVADGETSQTDATGHDQPAQPTAERSHVQPTTEQPPMVAYAPYPHHYYYPDPNTYSTYMDMSSQMHYDSYPPHDQRSHQPVIYY
jgi:hypothetical protein